MYIPPNTIVKGSGNILRHTLANISESQPLIQLLILTLPCKIFGFLGSHIVSTSVLPSFSQLDYKLRESPVSGMNGQMLFEWLMNKTNNADGLPENS